MTNNLYYIEWCDALNFSNEWHGIDSIREWAKTDDWIIRQAGYIICDTKQYIVIASQCNPKTKTENQFAEVTKIPKTWIRKKRKIVISS